jgi:hypothetical protein
MIALELAPLGVLPVDTGLFDMGNGANFLDQASVYISDSDLALPPRKLAVEITTNMIDANPPPKPK